MSQCPSHEEAELFTLPHVQEVCGGKVSLIVITYTVGVIMLLITVFIVTIVIVTRLTHILAWCHSTSHTISSLMSWLHLFMTLKEHVENVFQFFLLQLK